MGSQDKKINLGFLYKLENKLVVKYYEALLV